MNHIPYVYEITDRITGKKYIGSRYARKCEPEDLGVSYFTSSKIVHPMFKINPERFIRKIILIGDAVYVRYIEETLIDITDAVKLELYYNEANPKSKGKLGGKIGGKIGGRVSGRMNVLSGHLARIASAGGIRSAKLNWNVERASQLGKLRAMSGTLKDIAHLGGAVGGKTGGKTTTSQTYECLVCGKKCHHGAMGRHQNISGHVGKIKV